jgi:hypothetical protein
LSFYFLQPLQHRRKRLMSITIMEAPPPHNVRWATRAERGVNGRIVGPRQSAPHVLLGQTRHNRICVTPDARFGFHLADREDTTAASWAAYQGEIRQCTNQLSGLNRLHVDGVAGHLRYLKKC